MPVCHPKKCNICPCPKASAIHKTQHRSLSFYESLENVPTHTISWVEILELRLPGGAWIWFPCSASKLFGSPETSRWIFEFKRRGWWIGKQQWRWGKSEQSSRILQSTALQETLQCRYNGKLSDPLSYSVVEISNCTAQSVQFAHFSICAADKICYYEHWGSLRTCNHSWITWSESEATWWNTKYAK